MPDPADLSQRWQADESDPNRPKALRFARLCAESFAWGLLLLPFLFIYPIAVWLFPSLRIGKPPRPLE